METSVYYFVLMIFHYISSHKTLQVYFVLQTILAADDDDECDVVHVVYRYVQ